MTNKKWEYCTKEVSSYSMDSTLNNIGEEGWELVQMIPNGLYVYNCIFKRPYYDE